ncbi:MAG: NAD+ synthase [Candidatus Nanoarchaeia archaeon]|jgi:NH3-dependent NAD+ synthetase/predicted amidohydrolase|nr:NAD+ synthase [Candidatus Nanoarchaeia archaeon]
MNIVLCQIDTIVGDFMGNAQKVIDFIKQKTDNGVFMYVFPELTIPGYPLLDLVDYSAFLADQDEALKWFLEQTKEINSPIIIGYVEKNTGHGKKLYNSAAVCYKGEVIYNYRKRLLPTYDIFDESRYFQPGEKPGIFQFRGIRIGIVICEDLWYNNSIYTINPVEDLFNANVEFIISINGSPSVVGKHQERVEMIKRISKQYAMPIVYVNQVGGNDDIVFDGNSFVTNKRGAIILKSGDFVQERSEIDSLMLAYHTHGMSPGGIEHIPYASNAEFYFKQIVCGVRSYVTKCGFKGVAIGESGGIDSAVVSAVAKEALGSKRVMGCTMPSEYSSTGSYEDSEALCKNLGIDFHTLPIKGIYETILKEFNKCFGTPEKTGIAEENLQARIRGMILMTYSNRFGYLVLSTGNKSELSVGYCTMYGDMCGGLSPISDLPKMKVYELAAYYNTLYPGAISQAIIDKAPSAELAPGQKDVDSLPPYPVLDALLELFIEGDWLDPAEYEKYKIIADQHPEAVKRVCQLIKNAEFKRRQAPLGIKLHRKAFGFGRRIPIAQSWKLSKF